MKGAARWAAAPATLGVVVALCAQALAGTVANRRSARPAAQRMLATLVLPGAAQRSGGDPSRGSVLAHPAERPATPALDDVHAFWRAPGNPQTVLAWVRAHRPPGSRLELTGMSTTSRTTTVRYDGFAFPAVPGVLSSRMLLVAVAPAAGGGTAVRADAQVVWVDARPVSERIPAAVRLVTITVRRPGGPASAPRLVSSLRRVRQIAMYVDRLPLAQPGVEACPADFGPLMELDFRTAPRAAPAAVVTADGSGCGLVTLRLGARSEPALAGGPQLIRRVAALLGISVI